jgi:hypothetical protein
MLKFWKRPRRYSDQALVDLAAMLFSDPEQPTPFSDSLKPELMDYSIPSLSHVNAFLDVVRGKKLDSKTEAIIALRAGAYLGEVLRRHALSDRWHWLDYKTAAQIEPRTFETFGQSIATSAVLYDGHSGWCFPVSKVCKYLANGAEDDVQFFAQATIASWTSGSP